jgi:hypothetical protein
MKIWLVVQIFIVGQPPAIIEDREMPNLSECLDRAGMMLERATSVIGDDGFELTAACSVEKSKDRPASMQEEQK